MVRQIHKVTIQDNCLDVLFTHETPGSYNLWTVTSDPCFEGVVTIEPINYPANSTKCIH